MNSGHHKTIFSKRLGCLVAVGEHASSQGKANGAASGQFSGSAGTDWLSTVLQFVGVLTASCALVTLAWAGPVASTALPNSLPTGGQVAQGAASISQSGAVMNITQSTPKAVVNWNTFDIGQNAKVNIVQPGADAVMLNRVTSANPSQILGQLNANGQVVLVNPNGVLFGKDGSVNANSFTASTLGITDANFMAGNQQFERNGSTAAVVNQGRINASGGYVALLGASVSNEGPINTQGGTAYLAAAETVKIPVSGSGRIKLELSPSRINAAVANGKTGTIVTEGGQVYMQAASLSTMVASIIQSGSIDTTGAQGGAVHLLADGGQIKVDGSITANSTAAQNKGGDIVIGRDEITGVLAKATDVSGAKLESQGGFVETSAHELKVDEVKVKATNWLLDPDNIEITNVTAAVGFSAISANALGAALTDGTTVTINTTPVTGSTYNSLVSNGGTGKIVLKDAVTKSAGTGTASLNLIADDSITVNNAITASSGNLNVNLASGRTTVAGGITIAAAGSIDGKSGTVVLQTKGAAITSSSTNGIKGGNITLDNRGSTIDATGAVTTAGILNSGAANAIVLSGGGIDATQKLMIRGTANGGTGLSSSSLLRAQNLDLVGQSLTGAQGVFLGGGTSITTLAGGSASTIQASAAGVSGGTGAMFVSGTNVYDASATGTSLSLSGDATGTAAAATTGTRGMRIDDSAAVTTKGSVTLKGSSASSDGFLITSVGTALNAATGSLTLIGRTAGNGGGTVTGVSIQRGITAASGVGLTITGTAANTNASTAENAVYSSGALTGNGGALSITGAASSMANSNGVVTAGAVTGWGSVTLLGQNLRGSGGDAVSIGANLSSTGNMLLQSIGSRIFQTAGTISAARLTMDNTGAGQAKSLIADNSVAGLNWTTATAIGGAIDANGVVTSKGAGTSSTTKNGLNLDGVITTSGATYLSGETAAAGSSGVTGIRINNTVNATGVLTIDSNKDSVVLGSGNLTGGTSNAGGLTKVGSGTLRLQTNSTYKGMTNINAGTVTSTDLSTSMGTGTVNINAAGTLALSTTLTNQPILANTLQGTGNITYSGSSGNQMFLKGDISAFAGTVTVGASGTGGSLWFNNTGSENAKFVVNTGNNLAVWSTVSGANGGVDSGARTFNAGSLTGGGTVYSGGSGKQLTLSVGALGLTETFAGVIQNVWTGGGSATMNLTKVGTGTMTLTGTNTYSGGTQINAGTLASANSGSNFGSNTITVGSTGTLALSTTGGSTPTFTNAFAGEGNITYTGSSGNQMFFSGDMSTFAGTFTITGISTTTWFNNAGSTFASFINNGNAMGIWSNNGGGGVSTGSKTFNAGSLTGTGQIYTDGGNTKSITLSVGALNKNELYSGKISNSWNPADLTKLILTKVGTGTTTLTANNDYGGTTSITGGTLQIGNAGTTGTLGSGAVALLNDANLVYKRSSNTSIANAISGQGNVSADITGSGNVSVDNTITLNTGTPSATRNKIDLRANGNVTLSKAITTNNTGSDAVKLVAGQAANYVASSDSWSSLSGNVIVDPAGAITVGNGGVAALYSGTIAETTGIASMAVSGSGKFRYNSDETTTNFSAASAPLLGKGSVNANGVNIIYREAPEITVTAKSTVAGVLTYNGMVQNNPNNSSNPIDLTYGVTDNSATSGVLKNGDITSLTGTLGLAHSKGTETDLKNAGTYTVKASGLTNALGYKVKYVDGSLVIDQASLSTVTGSRDYNGSKVISGTFLVGQGVTVGTSTETVKFTGTGKVDSANVQYSGSAVTSQHLSDLNDLALSDGSNGGKASNYKLPALPVTAVTITPKDVRLSASRDYNGTKDLSSVTVSTGVMVGVTTETLTYQDAKAKFKDVTNALADNAGAANYVESITLKNATDGSGGLASNYKFTAAQSGTNGVTIIAKEVTLAAAKTYDGNKTLSASQLTITTDVGSETLSSSGARINSKNVGDNFTNYVDAVTLENGTGVNAGLASNYKAPSLSVRDIVKNTVVLSQLALTANIDAVTTTYGTNAGTGSVNLIGVIGADKVSAGSAGLVGSALSSSNNLKAGTYAQSVGGALSGTDAGNYTFSDTSSANYVVNKLALNTQIAGVTTTYGTTAATGAASVSGVIAGDKVDLANAKATLVDAANSSSGQLKAGTYKQTVANGLSGDDAANYTAAPTSLANYVVTPKAIAATVTAADKVYDGNNVATLNANSAGILTGDVVNVLGATGTFASKNVARDGSGNVVAQTVTVTGTGVGLGGTDGANYTLTNATSIASTTAKITPKDLSVSGITAIDKVYDGSTAAAINSANAVLAGVVTGDSVSVSTQSGVGNFASKDVAFDGAGVVASQAVTVSGLSLNGTAAGNYNVSDKSGAKAKVLQRALSITGSVAQDKTVDGNTNAQVKPGQLVNLVAGESLVVSATGQFADAEIGTNKAVTTQYALANGANGVARNYTLAGEVLRAAILVASINPVQPIVNPSRTGGGGRVVVSGSGNSGAALGVADGEEEVISREECSVLNPEKCECQESTIAGVEMCFAPTLAANTKN